MNSYALMTSVPPLRHVSIQDAKPWLATVLTNVHVLDLHVVTCTCLLAVFKRVRYLAYYPS